MDDSIPLAERISLYFDGSCQENRNVTAETPAGWGVVVVRGDSGLGKGDGEVIEELSGPVIVSLMSGCSVEIFVISKASRRYVP